MLAPSAVVILVQSVGCLIVPSHCLQSIELLYKNQ